MGLPTTVLASPSTLASCPFQSCSIQRSDACFYDDTVGSIVCDLQSYQGCHSNPEFNAFAVNFKTDVITIFGSCNNPDPTEPDIEFCCEHDQTGGHGISSLELLGRDTTEEILALRYYEPVTKVYYNLETHPSVPLLQATVRGREGNESIQGSYFNSETYTESLYGDAGVDAIRGGDGDDRLYGGADGDFLYGDGGVDRIWGGDGEDFLHGGDATDFLNGGRHDDHLFGDGGADVMNGNQGEDWMYGGDHDDILRGGYENDHMYGEGGADTMYGQSGNDFMEGGDGDDEMSGGAGEDTMSGGEDNDKMHGGSQEDTLRGNDGVDWLYGGIDTDVVSGGKGDDVICENQDYTGVPGYGQGQIARNDISGGDDQDTLYLDATNMAFPSYFPGDRTIERGFYPLPVPDINMAESTSTRLGDYDPNAVECVTLVNMFGQ